MSFRSVVLIAASALVAIAAVAAFSTQSFAKAVPAGLTRLHHHHHHHHGIHHSGQVRVPKEEKKM